MRRLIIPAFLCFLVQVEAIAQDDPGKVYDYAGVAADMYKRGAYDSAIALYTDALKLAAKHNMYKDVITTIILSNVGEAWQKKGNVVKAHEFYSKGLQNARTYNHSSEKIIILPQLMSLHKEIVTKDIPFNYPEVPEKVQESIFVELGKVTDEGDSITATIPAGKYDGITESSIQPQVYTHITDKDTAGHGAINYFSTGRIVSIGNNTTVIRFARHRSIKLLPGDYAMLQAHIPLQWQQLSLKKFLTMNLFFRDNYGQRLFDYRYFYYYADSLLESEVLDLAKATVQEIADMYAADTVTNDQFGKKAASGIFAGRNVMRAIIESQVPHLRYFLDYVATYPGKYIGNNYKFSETYATWLLNETPLIIDDIKSWLLTFEAGKTRQDRAATIRNQLLEAVFTDHLLDAGMRQINVEDIDAAQVTTYLMHDIVTGISDTRNIGWSDFLQANIEKRMMRHQSADSLLEKASALFKKNGNTEGSKWIRSTREQWKKNSQIMVGVQNGHMFPYLIAEPVDSRYFATGGKDNLIKIWDKTLGKEILTLTEHRDEINSLQYSSNGRYLVSTSDDSTICVWNAYNYSLVSKFHTSGVIRTAIFSPDNKFLVCAGEDSIIRFRDLQTGEVVKQLIQHKGIVTSLAYHPNVADWLYSCSTDSFVYKWEISTGEMIRWYRQQGKVLDVKLSNNGRYMSTISTDSSFTVWDTESNKKWVWGKLHVYKPGNVSFYAGGSFSNDSRYFAYPYKKDSFNVIDLRDFYERMYPTNQSDKYLNLSDLVFSKDGVSLYARFDMGGPLRIYNFAGWDIRNNTTISWKDIRPFSNLTVGVQFTADDNGLIILHNEIGKLDLRNASYEPLFTGGTLVFNSHLILNNEDLGTWFSNNPSTLHIYDHKKKATKIKFSLPPGEEVSAYTLHEKDDVIYLGTESGRIHAWSMISGDKLFDRKYGSNNEDRISQITYDSLLHRLIVITEEGKVFFLANKSGDIVGQITEINANFSGYNDAYVYLTTADGYLYKYDKTNFRQISRIRVNNNGEGAYQVAVSADNKYVILQSTFSSLMGIDAITDKILFDVHDHDYGGTMIAISHDSRRIATAGFDSRINLLDIKTGKRIVAINMPMDRGPVISDSNGYYLASRNALDAVIFSYNNNAYAFDQFDLQLNRPDIILAAIGRADTTLLRSYYLAYKKRLKKLGTDESRVKTDVHLPLARIRDRFALQPITTKKEFKLEIECSDSRFMLSSFQVLVNNCPLYGVKGMSLDHLRTGRTVQSVTIPLSEGTNDIKLFCTNENGVSSLRESFSIVSKYKPEKPSRTYFVGIGIAEYKDKSMNLGYSVKDIRDLARSFDRYYENMEVDTLINIRATKENILEIRKKLMQTTVNDRVILAVTGHGLLSDSLDFYYATYDVDFRKPEKRGLKYEDLENLLTDIPARKKLMLIDACHSGALDKDELLALKNDSTATVVVTQDKENNIKGRAPRGLIVKSKDSKMNANSSFEMMQRLFSDLSAGNGAVIISAAGGMEYAFESGKWNNGVFTYCVRKGIEDKMADTDGGNFDGKVSVQELLKFVSRKVSELTDGKQKPTSRRENIDFEWMIRN